jgi:hypothetical protein
MNFSFDPTLIARARQLILHGPNLDLLRPEHQGRYSPLVIGIQTELKKRNGAGMLLLPDLSALANSTIGIFSATAVKAPEGTMPTRLSCVRGALSVPLRMK